MADEAAFEKLKHTVSRLLDFDCSQYSHSFLARRFETRLRATAIADYESYELFLAETPEEQEHLLNELTIHITHFFRDAPVWNAFRTGVIPLLRSLRKEQGITTIKIWSAGCSTGEEPISIAISFYEALGPQLGGLKVTILASDRDKGTIAKALEATYDEEQLRETPESIKDRYFDQDEHGFYHPVQKILDLIQYRVADIINVAKPRDLDAIFCRNTVIYFDRVTKEKLYVDFFDSLRQNGFLIMGKTETLFGPARDKFQFFDNRERIYCKE